MQSIGNEAPRRIVFRAPVGRWLAVLALAVGVSVTPTVCNRSSYWLAEISGEVRLWALGYAGLGLGIGLIAAAVLLRPPRRRRMRT